MPPDRSSRVTVSQDIETQLLETRAVETQQRRVRQRWLDDLGAAARGRRALAAAAISLSGILLVAQAGAIAWLVQQVLFERRPLAESVSTTRLRSASSCLRMT